MDILSFSSENIYILPGFFVFLKTLYHYIEPFSEFFISLHLGLDLSKVQTQQELKLVGEGGKPKKLVANSVQKIKCPGGQKLA